ncbi:ATP-binding protein [Nonomuraea sp. NPDC000554]|uniref:ATP-binding protein n=1 Tax=Nonomuraea sp. NPDC000554 TaxID=3154259 RepID=UPI00332FEA15
MDGFSTRHDQATAGAADLIGREPEIQRLRRFVGRIAEGAGEALLLAGDPGVGKTSLLDQAAALAAGSGIRLLRATGSQFEADISYAALHQLLLPCLGEAPRLSPLLAGALNVALGLGEGAPPAQLLVASAVLALLQSAADQQPLLLVVDDLPWLDRASALVLGMVARRLTGLPVGLVAACRTGEPSFFDLGGLPVVYVNPLSEEAATELLTSRYPVMTPRVRRRPENRSPHPRPAGDDPARAAAAAGRGPGEPAGPAGTPRLPRHPGHHRRRDAARDAAPQPPAADRLRLPRPGAAPAGRRTVTSGRPGRYGRPTPRPGDRRRPGRREPAGC